MIKRDLSVCSSHESNWSNSASKSKPSCSRTTYTTEKLNTLIGIIILIFIFILSLFSQTAF